MGGDDSQKLLPWRGIISSPGRSKPPAHYEINTVTDDDLGPRGGKWTGRLSYRPGGSFLASAGGSILESAEGRAWAGGSPCFLPRHTAEFSHQD